MKAEGATLNARSPMQQLLADRRFVRWMTSEVVNTLGTGISTVVLPILIYRRTGSPAQTGIVAGLRVVPYLVFGLIAGPIADRFDRRRLLVFGLIGEGVAMATIPIADLFGQVSVAQIYTVTLLAAVCFVFADAAAFGALPSITGPERLPAANGLLLALTSAALVAGPAVGALLTTWIGAAPAIWFDAASFLLAAVVLAGIGGSFRPVGGERTRKTIRAQSREGIGFIWNEPVIRALVLIGFLNSLAFGAVIGQLVVYGDKALHIHEGGIRVGILYTAGAVGTLIAGLLFARIFTVNRVRFITPAALAAGSLITFGIAATSSFLVAVGLYVLLSWMIQLVFSAGITYRQLASPDHLVSSVMVVGRMVAWGGQPFGALLGGIATEAFGIRWMAVLAAFVFALASLAGLLSLRKAVEARALMLAAS